MIELRGQLLDLLLVIDLRYPLLPLPLLLLCIIAESQRALAALERRDIA